MKLQDTTPRIAKWTIYIVGLFFCVSLAWASVARIDEITRGSGSIIPAGKNKRVQNSTPGVVKEIRVREGEQVVPGQLLIRLDDTVSSASMEEVAIKAAVLVARIARLRIEKTGAFDKAYTCPEGVSPDICSNEAQLLRARREAALQRVAVNKERLRQRENDLVEARANAKRLGDNLVLAEQELSKLHGLHSRQLVAETDYIRARRDAQAISGELDVVKQATSRLKAAISEAQLEVDDTIIQFQQQAADELTTALAELESIKQAAKRARSEVGRADIRSPVEGTINTLEVTTIGAYLGSGQVVAEIVPKGSRFLVEARIAPKDIAFVRIGQPATVKITAYDYSIYGALSGIVEQVSADSIVDKQTNETFYNVFISTTQQMLEKDGKRYQIRPGMICDIEIQTGTKTVLSYILKPIEKTRREALPNLRLGSSGRKSDAP